MDDFKKQNVNEFTAHDLNAKCVCTNRKKKKKLKRICNKKARARLKKIVCRNCTLD